eukprot:9470787-Pyramimonas_sp.AAC.1
MWDGKGDLDANRDVVLGPLDAPLEAHLDAVQEAHQDILQEAPLEAHRDAPQEAHLDALQEARQDAPPDTHLEAHRDTPQEAHLDALQETHQDALQRSPPRRPPRSPPRRPTGWTLREHPPRGSGCRGRSAGGGQYTLHPTHWGTRPWKLAAAFRGSL